MEIVYENQDFTADISPEQEAKLGYYGMRWLDFMENNHPNICRKLAKNGTLFAVAESVNKTASNYKLLLDRQYEQLHPRPYEFEGEDELKSWTFTRNFYTRGAVMREKVLIKRTAV